MVVVSYLPQLLDHCVMVCNDATVYGMYMLDIIVVTNYTAVIERKKRNCPMMLD